MTQRDPSLPPAAPRRRQVLAGATATIASLGALAAAPARAQAVSATRAELTAQTTEGPYFLADMPVRADIAQGLPGVPLEVRLTVTDAFARPLPGCRVDLWQCDAAGIYSGYDGQGDDGKVSARGQTFLRGAQPTGADGVAAFRTLYPGWYAGRTTHIHFKVWNGPHAVLTSQFFLPDALSEFIYTALPAYKRGPLRGVLNSTDGIALMAGRTVLGSVREDTGRYVATLAVVVDPDARPVAWRPGSGPPPAEFRSAGGPPPGFGGRPPLPTPEGAARVQALVPGPRDAAPTPTTTGDKP